MGAELVIVCGFVCGFTALVFALHVLKRDIDPSWRMISEYEIGRWGWLMRLAFVFLSGGCLTLTALLWPHLPVSVGVFFGLVSLAPAGAAVFKTDPITTPRNQMGRESRLHATFGALFIIGFPIAATLAMLNNVAPATLTALVWVGFLQFIAAVAFFARRAGGLGPSAPIGWPNRALMASYVAWIVLVALQHPWGES
jgi:hypothetical protein